jgi:hypothetical protein
MVLSVVGVPVCDSDGRARLKVTGISAGRLPLPKFLFHSFLKSIDDRPIPAKISHWRMKTLELGDGKAVLFGEIVEGKQ